MLKLIFIIILFIGLVYIMSKTKKRDKNGRNKTIQWSGNAFL